MHLFREFGKGVFLVTGPASRFTVLFILCLFLLQKVFSLLRSILTSSASPHGGNLASCGDQCIWAPLNIFYKKDHSRAGALSILYCIDYEGTRQFANSAQGGGVVVIVDLQLLGGRPGPGKRPLPHGTETPPGGHRLVTWGPHGNGSSFHRLRRNSQPPERKASAATRRWRGSGRSR